MNAHALAAMTRTETRLFLREPLIWGAAVILPTAVLVILGAIFGNTPDPQFGGYGFLTLFTPSLVVITLATLTVNTFTSRMGTYREQGVLRRLSTTPVRPATLLAAQLAINIVTAFIAVAVLIGVAYVAFGVPLPQAPLAFAVALGVGAAALFGLALLIAAVVPSAGAANAVSLPVFFAVMFFGGVYLPQWLLPDFLNKIGEFIPPGVHGILDAWLGAPLQLAPLIVMGVIAVVAGAVAARTFRWE